MAKKAQTFHTSIDLPAGIRAEIIDLCNQQLADTSDLHSQTKQAHWNVKGPQFIALTTLDERRRCSWYVDELPTGHSLADTHGTARMPRRIPGPNSHRAWNWNLRDRSRLRACAAHPPAITDPISRHMEPPISSRSLGGPQSLGPEAPQNSASPRTPKRRRNPAAFSSHTPAVVRPRSTAQSRHRFGSVVA